MKGSQWTIAGYALGRLISFVTTLILARLLTPDLFGVLALATTFLNGILLFRDLGIGSILISDKTISRREERSILTMYLLIAPALSVVLLIVAAVFYFLGGGGIVEVLTVMSVQVLFSGLYWFLWPVIQKRQLFALQFFVQITQALVSGVFGVIFVMQGLGVAGVVWGQFVGLVCASLLQLLRSGDRSLPVWNPRMMRSVLRRGGPFFAQGALGFASQNADNVVAATMLGNANLGLYNAAYRLGELPYVGLTAPIFQVTFVRFSKSWNEGVDVRLPFRRSLRTILLLSLPFSMMLITVPESLLAVVLGQQWLSASSALFVMGFWSVGRAAQSAYGWLFNSTGQAGLSARIALAKLPATIGLLVLGAALMGISGLAIAMTIDVLTSLIIYLILARRRPGILIREFGSDVWRLSVCAAVSAIVASVVLELPILVSVSPVVELLLGVFAVLTVYGIGVILLERELVRGLAKSVRGVLGGDKGA